MQTGPRLARWARTATRDAIKGIWDPPASPTGRARDPTGARAVAMRARARARATRATATRALRKGTAAEKVGPAAGVGGTAAAAIQAARTILPPATRPARMLQRTFGAALWTMAARVPTSANDRRLSLTLDRKLPRQIPRARLVGPVGAAAARAAGPAGTAALTRTAANGRAT